MGRKCTFPQLILSLDPDQLYTAYSIVELAKFMGHFGPSANEKDFSRLRKNLITFKRNYGFPSLGDGLVQAPGRVPTPGWYGKRWQAVLKTRRTY